jgi:hypothetical protein
VLGDGEEWVYSEVGQGWGGEWARYEPFDDPGGDGVRDVGSEEIGRWGVWAGQGG